MTTTIANLPGTQVQTRWALVNPFDARLFLQANTDNRPIRKVHLEKLMKDLQADRYKITHQGIAFDLNGVLRDGQHRLMAIAETGIPQWLLVTTGLEPDSQQEMDGGAKRAASDFMEGSYAPLRSSAGRIVLAVREVAPTFTAIQLTAALTRITTGEILSLDADTQALLRMHSLDAARAARNTPAVGPSALLAAATFYPDRATEFLSGMAEIVGLGAEDPRAALIRFRGGDRRIQHPTSAFVAIKAAKAFQHGAPVKLLRYPTPTETVTL
jgi:hypothetical protein